MELRELHDGDGATPLKGACDRHGLDLSNSACGNHDSVERIILIDNICTIASSNRSSLAKVETTIELSQSFTFDGTR